MREPADSAPGAAFLARCDPYQAAFHARWHHLASRHGRALAYLLTAPDMLDPASARWHGRVIDSGPLLLADGMDDWLAAIDLDDTPLRPMLGPRAYTRLGLYAEKLLAAWFELRGMLAAHSLQVQADRNDTVGEFDFLLRTPGGLLHVELATKFYLLADTPEGAGRFGHFVGPNLGDRFSAKMDKILERQLALGAHPAAQDLLPAPLADARALVKGWLFYRGDYLDAPVLPGLHPAHQRGFWCALDELPSGAHLIVLPKMHWLAPAAVEGGDARVLGSAAMRTHLAQHFSAPQERGHPPPMLVAQVERAGDRWLETRRGFVVPPEWEPRAAQYAAR